MYDHVGANDILLKSGLVPVCSRCIIPGRAEKAFFFLDADPKKYDSAHQVTVLLTLNESIEDCFENRLLRSTLSTKDKLDRLLEEIKPTVLGLGAEFKGKLGTGIHVFTEENGALKHKIYEEIELFDGFIELPEIPQSLASLPTVSISELTRLERIAYAVDLVDWCGEKLVYKKTLNASSTLTEITSLYALRECDTINPPQALVIDETSGTPRIRGFLSRFLPGGTLGAFLERRQAQREAGGPQVSIPLRTKLLWVFAITRLLLSMQTKGVSPNGDIKPENIMLDGRGRIRIVDFAPAGPTYEWGAPEYVAAWDSLRPRSYGSSGRSKTKEKGNNGESEAESEAAANEPERTEQASSVFDLEEPLTLTSAMDIYGLGAIMWAVGEEKASGLERRTWENSEGWYIELAEWCLRPDPARRPSAARLMFSLISRNLFRLVGGGE